MSLNYGLCLLCTQCKQSIEEPKILTLTKDVSAFSRED